MEKRELATGSFHLLHLYKNDPARWPEADVHDGEVNQTRPWLHSDLRAKAYSHNYLAFDKFVEIGNLNQTN